MMQADLSVAQAGAAIAAALQPVQAVEPVALADALGRVLGADLLSPLDVPGHDNAAMDGYAFDGAALEAGASLRLRPAATVLAGASALPAVGAGHCVRIMTGAPLPPGANTVIPFELCVADGEHVGVPAGSVGRGDHVRRRGEDLMRGQLALRAGRVLQPADLGLAASVGLLQLPLRRRLRVALLSTGDEVTPPGQPLQPGCIYDSNHASLAAALRRMGIEPLDLGAVRDDPQALAAALAHAGANVDAVLSSGGVSAGDADHTRRVLAEAGALQFWKVAMRPGRPFGFGRLHGGAWLFALPGNPVAALLSFYVLARPGLLRLAGAAAEPLPLLRARSAGALDKRKGRSEFQRARLRAGADGRPEVQALPDQGSAVLSGMSRANALIVLGPERGPVAAGEDVDLWVFDGLI